MDYPSKRQKMSRPTIQIPRTSPKPGIIEELGSFTVEKKDGATHGAGQAVIDAASELHERGAAPLSPQVLPERSIPRRPRFQRRNAATTHREENKTITKSVVNVIIDEGSTAVAALTITDPSVANPSQSPTSV